MKYIIIFCLLLFTCKEPDLKAKVYIGQIVDANIVTTHSNIPKEVIKTDRSVFMIYRTPMVVLGDSVFMLIFSDGSRRVTWSSTEYTFYIE
jgi:hypothetical protein